MSKRILLSALIIVALVCAGPLFAEGQQEMESAVSVPLVTESEDAVPEWLVENTDDHITIIDSSGSTVTIQKPVESMVADGMGQVFAAIKALKAEDMILASCEYVTRNKDFFPVIAELPPIGMGGAVDYEMIISLEPDFICIDPFRYPEYEALSSEIPVVQLTFNSTEVISILGAILDKEAEAEEFVNWIESYTDIVEERVDTLDEEEYQDVLVYYGGEYGMAPPPPYGCFGADNYLRNELITKAGGISISREIPGDWISVDPEWVIEKNPPLVIRECYILNQNPEMGYGVNNTEGAAALMSNIYGQPAFESSDAVKSGNVYLLYGDLATDSWFISLVYMAKWFHPELFNDLDPEKMHQEYLSEFQRLEYDVSTQGLFAYPEN